MQSNGIIYTMTWERLAAMDDNGNSLYVTPNTDGTISERNLYWASRPNFTYDYSVASVSDFRTAEDIEYSREEDAFDENEIFSVTI